MMSRVSVLKQVPKLFFGMLLAPVRIRRNPPTAPEGPEHYVVPTLVGDAGSSSVRAADVPKMKTPEGRWRDWPPMVLADCDEPLVEGAADLRGVWQAHSGSLKGHIERIEQAGDRVVITAGGVIHDMFADGTLAGGVNDEGVGGAAISVAARFENGRLNLYLGGKRLVVTRYLEGDELVWRWGPYTNRLERLDGPVTDVRP